MTNIHKTAATALQKAAEDMKRFHNQHAGEEPSYKPGTKVFLDGRNLTTSQPSSKMEDKWFGPYEVLEKIGASVYKLKLPKTMKVIHPVFNVSLLKPFMEPAFNSQIKPPPPPPVLVDSEEEYEVDEILNSHLHRGKLQFLVK